MRIRENAVPTAIGTVIGILVIAISVIFNIPIWIFIAAALLFVMGAIAWMFYTDYIANNASD